MFDGNPFYGIEKLDFPPVVNEELEDGTGRKYQYCWEDSAVTGSDTARVLKAELSISTEKK